MKKVTGVFTVSSMLSHRTKEGIVTVHFNGEAAQMPPATARELALNLLQAAEAATSDQIMWEFMTELAGVDDDEELNEQQQAAILMKFRELRDKAEGAKE